jgi:hypothetical protein
MIEPWQVTLAEGDAPKRRLQRMQSRMAYKQNDTSASEINGKHKFAGLAAPWMSPPPAPVSITAPAA